MVTSMTVMVNAARDAMLLHLLIGPVTCFATHGAATPGRAAAAALPQCR